MSEKRRETNRDDPHLGAIASTYPAPVAVVWREYESETHPFRKFHRLIDAFEALVKYCSVIAIQNFYLARLDETYPEVTNRIREVIARPSLGHWVELLRETMNCFEQNQSALFCPQLFGFAQQTNQGRLKKAVDELLALRNKYVGHGATLPDEEASVLVQKYQGELKVLLDSTPFLTQMSLFIVEAKADDYHFQVKPLMGVDYQQASSQNLQLPTGRLPLPVGHVVVHNPETKAYLDLHPLLLYSECVETISGKECRQRKVMFFNRVVRPGRMASERPFPSLGKHDFFKVTE